MDTLCDAIAAKKERLAKLRPVSREALARLERCGDIELSYTSNAIEGNTLSPVETTLVIEQGLTIGGKPLKDHLEVLDHYDAIVNARELARQTTTLTESDVRNLHRLVMPRSSPSIAGRHADLPRDVRTEIGRHAFPSPAEVPSLMNDFARWLGSAPDLPDNRLAVQRTRGKCKRKRCHHVLDEHRLHLRAWTESELSRNSNDEMVMDEL